jgi:AraC-like DNA-binding protein
MNKKKELEIVRHTAMNHLEIFLLEMILRQPHGHEDLEIGILMEGSVYMFLETKPYLLKKGDIYIINRHQVHSFTQAGEKNKILAFQLGSAFYQQLNPALAYLQFENTIIHSGVLHDQIHEKLLSCALCYFNQDSYYELRCGSWMLEILYDILSDTHSRIVSEKESLLAQSNSLRLTRITNYISSHYRENISLQDIANQESITVYHLSHFIKKMLGISFQEYLNNVRFEHALQLVRHSDFNILNICLETGFSNSRYLNQMFEKRLGCTVREYRKLETKPAALTPSLPTDNVQKRFSTIHAKELLIESMK